MTFSKRPASRRRRSTVQLEELEERAALEASADLEPDFVREVESLEQNAAVVDAVGLMDERCRQLLSWLYLEADPLSYTEISERAGIPIGSIGPTRARCLEKLKKQIFPLSSAGPGASTSRSRPVGHRPRRGTGASGKKKA
jgi:RNA polymerase sigma factor (sigma-70 family)